MDILDEILEGEDYDEEVDACNDADGAQAGVLAATAPLLSTPPLRSVLTLLPTGWGETTYENNNCAKPPTHCDATRQQAASV